MYFVVVLFLSLSTHPSPQEPRIMVSRYYKIHSLFPSFHYSGGLLNFGAVFYCEASWTCGVCPLCLLPHHLKSHLSHQSHHETIFWKSFSDFCIFSALLPCDTWHHWHQHLLNHLHHLLLLHKMSWSFFFFFLAFTGFFTPSAGPAYMEKVAFFFLRSN